jgi:hypothetical protein
MSQLIGLHRAEARLCPHCDLNKVETEIHFLLKCQQYQNLINDFYKQCSENICENYWQLSNENKLIWIMSNETPLIVQRPAVDFKMFQTWGQQSQWTVNLFQFFFCCINWRVWFQNAINPFVCIREKCSESLKFTYKPCAFCLHFGLSSGRRKVVVATRLQMRWSIKPRLQAKPT